MQASAQKGQALITNLKQTAHQYAKKVEKLSSTQRKKYILLGVGFAALNLAYSLFSLYTLLSFGLVVAGIVVYIKVNIDEIKKKGLITFLPPKLQKTLLQRSLFDVLCDIWFIPRISIYAKALASPFFLKLDPSEAINQFKDFPPPTRKAILTKGIINIMPNLIQDVMLPHNELASEESLDLSSVGQEDQQIANKEAIISKSIECNDQDGSFTDNLFNEAVSGVSTNLPVDSLSLQRFESNAQNGIFQTSTDDDGFFTRNSGLNNPIETRQASLNLSEILGRSSSDSIKKTKDIRAVRSKERKTIPKPAPRVTKTYDSESDLRSEILCSNKMMKPQSQPNRKGKIEVSETWDKLELFVRKHREALQKQKSSIGNVAKKLEFKGPLQMVQNIVLLLSKDAIMNKLEDKKLFKVFIISSLALLLQFSISKKTRYWCYNTLNILMYISGFTLSTGSVALLMFKLRTKYLRWKEGQKTEIPKEIRENGEENDGDDDQQ